MTIDANISFPKIYSGFSILSGTDNRIIERDFLPCELMPDLTRSNVDGVIAVQSTRSADETSYLTELASVNSFIRGIIGITDLESDDLPENLDLLRQSAIIKGFRYPGAGDPGSSILKPGVLRGVKVLKVYNFSFDLPVYPDNLENSFNFIDDLPDVRILIDFKYSADVSYDLSDYRKQVGEIASCAGLMCKFSGLINGVMNGGREKNMALKYLDIIMDSFGPGRMIFGSDWPYSEAWSSYKKFLKTAREVVSNFDNNEQEMIFGENASGFYRLNS